MEHDFQPPLRAAEPGVAMTPLPHLDPAALEAARTAILQEADGAPIDEWISIAVRAYLAARSTAPEAGKAVDEAAKYSLLRDAALDATRKCMAAWAAGEPAHRVKDMIDAIEKLQSLVDPLHMKDDPALASVPAPSGAREFAFHAQKLREVAAMLAAERIQGWVNPLVCILTDAADAIAGPRDFGHTGEVVTSAAPQAVPAEDVAGLVERLRNAGNWQKVDVWVLCDEAAAALTSLSARLDWAESGQRTDNINSNRYFEKWQASEAEATSLRHRLDMLQADFNDCNSVRADLRRKLEEAERQGDDWKATHGRVIQGFAEVCEAVGVQFDAPDAVAYAINAKVGNAEHDLRAAERKLEEHIETLAEAREHINRYADTAAEHDLVARIDALATPLPEDTNHGR